MLCVAFKKCRHVTEAIKLSNPLVLFTMQPQGRVKLSGIIRNDPEIQLIAEFIKMHRVVF